MPTSCVCNADRAVADGVRGRLGNLEVRLARSSREIRYAQKLRYQVFYQEMSAIAGPASRLSQRDIDDYDSVCDHLLVLDHAAPERASGPAVVGTYRMLRHSVAERHGGFYSAGEFDIGGLLARQRNLRFLEVGRSCVLAAYRSRRTVELLWHGIWSYVLHHGLDVLIGCASLPGTDPRRLAVPLSFLHHHATAPASWHARAWPDRYVEMNRLPKSSVDPRVALRELPPLIKGYLRLGAFVGEGAVVDNQFGTIDVLIVLPVTRIDNRYMSYFTSERHAHKHHAAAVTDVAARLR
jgi:putative hemolysin